MNKIKNKIKKLLLPFVIDVYNKNIRIPKIKYYIFKTFKNTTFIFYDFEAWNHLPAFHFCVFNFAFYFLSFYFNP